ncbi:MAG: hypothetical protein ACRDNF_00720 [Streptosporangiaceae bacterium]
MSPYAAWEYSWIRPPSWVGGDPGQVHAAAAVLGYRHTQATIMETLS